MKIKNPFLSVQATSYGGALTSVQLFSQEVLYQKEGRWPFQDAILFPLIGRADHYTCGYVPMSMSSHGFLHSMDMKEEQVNETCLRFSAESNPDTLRNFPYPFRFIETLYLEDDVLVRSFEVKNTGSSKLPFALGAHPAFRVKFGKAKLHYKNTAYVPYAKGMTSGPFLAALAVNEGVTLGEDRAFLEGQSPLILVHDYEPILLETGLGVSIEFYYPSPYVAIWCEDAKDGLLCVEPWWGLPRFDHDPEELLERETLNQIEPGQSKTFTTRIRFRLD